MARCRPRPRCPFVVTVALAAATGACGGSTSSDPSSSTGATVGSGGGPIGGTGGVGDGGPGAGGIGGSGGFGDGGTGGCGANPPSIPCPELPPEEGSLCPVNTDPCFGMWWGTTCSYPDPCGATTELQYECSGSTWKLTSGSVTCTSCPATEPAPGSPCSLTTGEMCMYKPGCCYVGYSCLDGQWTPQPTQCPPPAMMCPQAPPNPGAACDPCTTAPECIYDTCASLGKVTQASCENGIWGLSGAPCPTDGGAP